MLERVKPNERCGLPNVTMSDGRQVDIIASNRTISIDLWYPRNESNFDEVEVGICEVRSADSIRIRYDFERDGYSIRQARGWDGDPAELEWAEVAFIKAWAREGDDQCSKQSD